MKPDYHLIMLTKWKMQRRGPRCSKISLNGGVQSYPLYCVGQQAAYLVLQLTTVFYIAYCQQLSYAACDQGWQH
jgi:hypothetical protein